MQEQAELRPDYRTWLERVRATYVSVAYTCGYRLHDPELGERVGATVVAGLVARPGVFRYQGLPFGGRLATLAEAGLAEARAGRLPPSAWPRLYEELGQVPPSLQHAFVLSCVDGLDLADIATLLGCGEESARSRCAEARRTLREIALRGIPISAMAESAIPEARISDATDEGEE